MGQIIDGETGLMEVSPPAGLAECSAGNLPLSTPVDVRREQAKVYREARGGTLDRADASKLIWMLGEIRKSIETEEIDKRLAAIEAQRGLTGPR